VTPLAQGNVVFRGVPTAYADQISEIMLEVTPEHRMARIVISQVDGATTEYRFTEPKEDVPLAAGRFQFKPPAGTETVDDLNGP
jgi:outer membrane lipoprotein-sorting protein